MSVLRRYSAAAYFDISRIDPLNPRDSNRDRLIVGMSRAAPALFEMLALKGSYDPALVDSYGQDGGLFAEHPPTPDQLRGIEAKTGSLSHGLPVGLCMGYAAGLRGMIRESMCCSVAASRWPSSRTP